MPARAISRVLSEWREAERVMNELRPESRARPIVEAGIAELRDVYFLLTEASDDPEELQRAIARADTTVAKVHSALLGARRTR